MECTVIMRPRVAPASLKNITIFYNIFENTGETINVLGMLLPYVFRQFNVCIYVFNNNLFTLQF